MPGYALPLAMLSLDQGRVDWLDEPMVRRELAALGRDTLGLGLSHDPLRLAHYLHYSEALEDTVAAYEDAGAAPRFAARDHFRTLPAAGQLPSACIDPGGVTQSFFPAEMKVDVSLAPDDELPALIEESFAYPPIDLTRAPEEQGNVSILILAPVSRARLREQIGALRPIHRAIRPATLFGNGHVKPIERIKTFGLSLRDLDKASRPPESSVTESAWSQLVRSSRYLWYVRRRTLSRNVALESILVQVVAPEPPGDGPPPEDGMSERMERIERELASHAPVSTLVEGRITETASGKVGDTVEVSTVLGEARLGMAVLFGATTVQGVVKDIVGATAQVRITRAPGASFSLPSSQSVRFLHKGASHLALPARMTVR